MIDSQRTGIFIGECGQENVGKMHDNSPNGLLWRIKEPGENKREWEFALFCAIFVLFYHNSELMFNIITRSSMVFLFRQVHETFSL